MSAHGRPSTAAVFGPITLAKSSVPSVKRVAASICQTKRNGKRRGTRFQRSRTGRGWRRIAAALWRALALRRLLGAAKATEQRNGRAGAEPQHGGGPGRDVAVGAAIGRRLAGELLGAERDEVALVAEAFARRRHRLDQFAIGGENRRRPIEIREQPLRAVGQAKAFAGALGRNHQHGGTVVGERDARAKTDQRAADSPRRNPRSRSSRGAPPCGSVPARRAICAAAGMLRLEA